MIAVARFVGALIVTTIALVALPFGFTWRILRIGFEAGDGFACRLNDYFEKAILERKAKR